MTRDHYLILALTLVLALGTASFAQNPSEVIRVKAAANDPASVSGRMIQLLGVLSVLNQDSCLWDASDETALDAWVDLVPGWEQASPKSAVRTLGALRRRSGITYPYRGISVLRLDYERADVLLEGTLATNPDYHEGQAKTDDTTLALLTEPLTRRQASRYVFRVVRILELRERRASQERGAPVNRERPLP